MKRNVFILLFGVLVLVTASMTSCKKEPIADPNDYSITLTADPGGSAEATVNGKAVTTARGGVKVTLTATPEENYRFTRWTVISGDLELSGNPVTFTMLAEDISVKAEFTETEEGEVNVFDYITDPSFKAYCAQFDTDSDNYLSVEEAQAVTEICLNDFFTVASLDGIEYFTSLTSLECYKNVIESVDLSKNTELTNLHVGTNWLTTLDVSNNTKLVSLYCQNNPIEKLDLSKCPELKTLYCHYCTDLTGLDVSKNTKLTEISAAFCSNLARINVSNNPALKTLDISNCMLSSLEISSCIALETLYCKINKITDLDVSRNVALKVLWCYENQITALNISNSPALEYLLCYNNRMTELNASTMSSPNNYSLGCGVQTSDGNTAQTLTLTLREEQKPYWELFMAPYDDMNANVVLDGDGADIFLTITDPIFKTYCEQFDKDGNGKLSVSEAREVESILVSNKGISSLTGIEYFENLRNLTCDNNQLTSLNTTKLAELRYLDCGNNQLTSLDVRYGNGGKELNTIYCDNNKLTKLSVAGCGKLVFLDCQNNQLTDLNLNYTESLNEVICSNNQLTALYASNSTELASVICKNNKLTKLDFYFTGSLAQLDCSENQLTSLNVAGKKSLMSLICNTNQLPSLDISGCTGLRQVLCYENRMTAFDFSAPTVAFGYTLLCGTQTSDGSTEQNLTLTLREDQMSHWNNMKNIPYNKNVVLAE